MQKWPLIKSKTCAHDDDDPGSEKLAVSREHAAPWWATPPGGPIEMRAHSGQCIPPQVTSAFFSIPKKKPLKG
ncbi:hypothetical protein C7R95_10305 [Enterobacter hormaechei]|nr:hypothetical protein C7R95_10305 [Enterobacter hormaechei]